MADRGQKVETSAPRVRDAADARARRERRVTALLALVIALPIAGYLTWDLVSAGKVAFKRPWALLLVLALPLAYWTRLWLDRSRRATLGYSSTATIARLRRGLVARLVALPGVLRVIALGLMAVALAGPQTRDRGGRVEVEGIDIVLALDLSTSMEATDLAPNRLEAAKKVIDEFISRRSGDRIGLVVFAREAYTHCPLTLDYSVLRNMLSGIRLGLIDGSGTAIGNALGVSLARIRSSDAKSRVVILLTDGDNNSGNVTPQQAARYAAAMKVKVFTILVGPDGNAPQQPRGFFGRFRAPRRYPVNPKLLKEIAKKTGGKAYRATDREALRDKFGKILDELDKSTRKDVAAPFVDAYRPFVVLALLLLLLEVLLELTRLRRFP
ncbi:MAG: VWA domain-containing protein [Myxococcales bacterium]|nr:VWA domain-containing protein [Myxococcales bacterium]